MKPSAALVARAQGLDRRRDGGTAMPGLIPGWDPATYSLAVSMTAWKQGPHGARQPVSASWAVGSSSLGWLTQPTGVSTWFIPRSVETTTVSALIDRSVVTLTVRVFPAFALRAGDDVPGFDPPGDVGFDFTLGANVSSPEIADLYLGSDGTLHAPYGAARMSGLDYLTDLGAPPTDFPITEFRDGGVYVLRTREARLAAFQVSTLSSAVKAGLKLIHWSRLGIDPPVMKVKPPPSTFRGRASVYQ